MKTCYKFFIILILLSPFYSAHAQGIIKAQVYDRLTKEAIPNASVYVKGGGNGTVTNAGGTFRLKVQQGDSLVISSVNYFPETIAADTTISGIGLEERNSELTTIVVSGSRSEQRKKDVPAAISTIDAKTIADTKANRLDQLLNKVTGVFMVSLGNEQHEMSIRQPLTTKSFFLYLEDGIPIRTTGLYNHNALIEMNMAATQRIEVIRGPSSSLYGAEAVGGAVNIITVAPPAVASGKISVEGNNNGYKRADLQWGNTFGKWGVVVSGYYANRHDGPIAYSDFHKTAFTISADDRIDSSLIWKNSLTYISYYSDMTGALDSAHFADKDYSTPYSFTYRKVNALRLKSQLTKQWSADGQTQFTAMFRDNSVGQNPSYYITNNSSDPMLANGQINDDSFNSFLFLTQHQQQFRWLHSKIIAGVSADISPSKYTASYIRIQRDAAGDYTSYVPTDSSLSDYATGISNVASYAQYDISPLKRLNLVIALRYDFFHYNFRNHLPASASTGAPSTRNSFGRLTPKIGFTYNLQQAGFYGNYSQGYVPPQVTELFNNVKVPYLKPQIFFNYEIGGWFSFVEDKLYADWSLYLMKGTGEIISVRQDDGSYQNQNAGETRHEGIEYGITYHPDRQWSFRINATHASHVFLQDVEKGIDYSGNVMSAAPRFIANAEMQYSPAFLRHLHLSVEWQHLGSYWMDNANTTRYKGFDVANIRAGYSLKHVEIWANALNVLNRYYAVLAAKSSYGYSYNLGDPREFTIGVSYRFEKGTR